MVRWICFKLKHSSLRQIPFLSAFLSNCSFVGSRPSSPFTFAFLWRKVQAYRPRRVRFRLGQVRAWIYRPYWFLGSLLGGPRLQVGVRFSLQGRLILRGPGKVILGDDVVIDSVTTLFTHSREAVIQIGSKSYINGARMGCFERIELGEASLLGDCRVMDSDFHPVHKRRMTSHEAPPRAPVQVGNHVWLAAGCAVLKGVRIGDYSVIAMGAIVTHDVPAGRIFGGNPARDLGPVPD